jgi:hypothetical protein
MLRLEVIYEAVPVTRVRQNRPGHHFRSGSHSGESLVNLASELIVRGSFRYQACYDTKCYIPQEAPLEWHFQPEGLDKGMLYVGNPAQPN